MGQARQGGPWHSLRASCGGMRGQDARRGRRVGGYLVVWGHPAQRDLHGEYFTPDTDLGLTGIPAARSSTITDWMASLAR